jgi:MoxR-like ATPase
VSQAAYEWNYARQMLEIRLGEATHESRAQLAAGLFTERFLIARPLLAVLKPHATPPVLLIDELDRADEPFEAYLLEFLADFQITIPEFGLVSAAHAPIVVITSNRTREIHDAVKRRCIYHWVDYPDAARELEIIRRKVPGASEALSRQIVAFVQGLRTLDLYKLPGLSETIEWGRALLALDRLSLDAEAVDDTLGVLLKGQDDIARVRGSEAARLLERITAGAAAG